jgi:molybdopterin synthase sulfur carrier subunit
MRIKVRGYLTLREVIGGRPFRVVEADRLTVAGLVERLSAELGEVFDGAVGAGVRPGEEGRNLVVLVNGRHVSHLPEGLETELADGDEVSVFPVVAGG